LLADRVRGGAKQAERPKACKKKPWVASSALKALPECPLWVKSDAATRVEVVRFGRVKANQLHKQGRYSEAEPLYKRSLAVVEKAPVTIIPRSQQC
jgi:hypothetical protein